MSDEIKLWHDCPACPNCQAKVGCPAAREERGRWYGPAESNLFCPACGTAWMGSPEEMAQALRAQQAWDRKLYVESGEGRLLEAVDRCLVIIGDRRMHNAGKGAAVRELERFLRAGAAAARLENVRSNGVCGCCFRAAGFLPDGFACERCLKSNKGRHPDPEAEFHGFDPLLDDHT